MNWKTFFKVGKIYKTAPFLHYSRVNYNKFIVQSVWIKFDTAQVGLQIIWFSDKSGKPSLREDIFVTRECIEDGSFILDSRKLPQSFRRPS